MRRLVLALVLVSGAAPVTTAAAQRVRFSVVDTAGPGGTRVPFLRTPGILRDARWLEALQNSFPLRIQFHVEIWRVRTDWFDALERTFDFEVLVEYEPLTDQYSVTQAWGGARRRFERLSTLGDLERRLEQGYQVTISPAGTGEYYFVAEVRIRTLTDQEMDQLERFLSGSPDEPDRERGSALTRGLRRLLLKFGGLPTETLEDRTARFTVGPARTDRP